VKESKNLEFKRELTNTFLKTVSAFANDGGGRVVFGIDDNGSVVGVANLKETELSIEQKINDTIDPVPEFSIYSSEADHTITLEVLPGKDTPYLYKGKGYYRSGTSTVEADRFRMRRLYLAGSDLEYEELPSRDQDLSFSVLEEHWKEKARLPDFSQGSLFSLGLYSNEDGYNNAAAILADTNRYYLIDVACFAGTDITSDVVRRERMEKISVLSAYDRAVELFLDVYRLGSGDSNLAQNGCRIPEDAFREALANAVAHRTWDNPSCIRVMMFPDRIEVMSEGGLPNGISPEQFWDGDRCVPRNPVLAGVLSRLGMMELLATGMRKIRNAYRGSIVKPDVKYGEGFLTMILPVVVNDPGNLTISEEERMVYNEVSPHILRSISDITEQVPFGKTKVTQILHRLVDMGLVRILGNGRGTKYYR